ncbi:ATP-grasp domain-containing protein [Marinimicrobium agarilyticum]|uniref:carboxylate--amine ligase n=1 Tax=Marinimicrobium agarilyticum TaxID=306546 RepID=UPI000414EEE1|nr:ATP-grasp domain-containing protein [Marinimicrobium agarilyticum]
MSEHSFDFVVPVTEVTSQLLLNQQDALPGLRLPFATYDTVMALADKGRLMEQAAKLEIPHPKTRWFAHAGELDLGTVEYPVVLKPCLSKIFTGTGWIATRVRVLQSFEDLKQELDRSGYLHSYPFMLQAFIPGNGAGIFCLYDQGRSVTYFAHKRLREKPPEGGVSVLSESALPDPSMQAYATRLLDAVGWHGVAMVEFRVAPDGTPYLMEVNTRFWGSLQLAIDAGVDFPGLLWEVHQGHAPNGPDRYRVGQRLRWLLGDLDSLYLYLRGPRTGREKVRRLLEFATPRFSGLKHEVNRWGDLRPAWFELKHYLKDLTGR